MKAGSILDNKKFLLILGILTSVLVVVAIVVIRNAIRRKRARKVAVIIETAKMNPNVQVDKQGFVDVKSLQGGGGKPQMDEGSSTALATKLVKDLEGCFSADTNTAIWMQFNGLSDADFRYVNSQANVYMKEKSIDSNCGSDAPTFYYMLKSEASVYKTDFNTLKKSILARMDKLGIK